jgi:hypothetical protein
MAASAFGFGSTSPLTSAGIESEYVRKQRVAFRPGQKKSLTDDPECFWLQVVYEKNDSMRVDSFEAADLINLGRIFSTEEEIPSAPRDQRSRSETPFRNFNAEDHIYSGLQFLSMTGIDIIGSDRAYILTMRVKDWIENSKIERAPDVSDIMYLRVTAGEDNPVFSGLKVEVEKMKKNLEIVDFRTGAEQTNLNLCIDIIRGLHVTKTTSTDNILMPLYVIVEGIQWHVHNVQRLTKRTHAELHMLEMEISRRCAEPFDLTRLLLSVIEPQARNAKNVRFLVQAVARCIEARMTYSWYKHELSTQKHLLASRLSEWENEVETILLFLSTHGTVF